MYADHPHYFAAGLRIWWFIAWDLDSDTTVAAGLSLIILIVIILLLLRVI